jgi:TRAP transporter TAXI family solute receptor
MRYPVFAILAAIMAAIGVTALAVYLATLPTTLRVAVGPVSNEDVRVIVATLQTFQREQEAFRIRLVLTDGSRQSSAMVDEGKADIAVVRTDIAYPRSAATVAVMHTDIGLLVAPGQREVKAPADLRGKLIGVTRDNEGNRRLLRLILGQAGLGESDYRLEGLRPAEVKPAIDSGRLDAVFAVAPRSSRVLADIVQHLADANDGNIRFIPVTDAPAIEQRFPLIEAETILRGLFAGNPSRPEKDIATVMVSHEMLASKTLSEATVADFTRTLLSSKSQIAAEAPLAASLDTPDQERTSPIPIHQGTTTYLDGQTSTFLERYGDWFYIAIMAVGLGGSLIAGLFSAAASRARRQAMVRLAELQSIGIEARKADGRERFDELEAAAETVFSDTMAEAANYNIDATALVAFQMAFDNTRRAIENGRRRIGPVPAE